MKIAVIRIRGNVHVTAELEQTFKQLKVLNQNMLAIHEHTPSFQGQLQKAKDFITWGTISDATIQALKARTEHLPNVYRLNPPKKGFGRKGIKQPFVKSGALGDRKEKINDLIVRMI
jgi:large subunit ribosomal protein L30